MTVASPLLLDPSLSPRLALLLRSGGALELASLICRKVVVLGSLEAKEKITFVQGDIAVAWLEKRGNKIIVCGKWTEELSYVDKCVWNGPLPQPQKDQIVGSTRMDRTIRIHGFFANTAPDGNTYKNVVYLYDTEAPLRVRKRFKVELRRASDHKMDNTYKLRLGTLFGKEVVLR